MIIWRSKRAVSILSIEHNRAEILFFQQGKMKGNDWCFIYKGQWILWLQPWKDDCKKRLANHVYPLRQVSAPSLSNTSKNQARAYGIQQRHQPNGKPPISEFCRTCWTCLFGKVLKRVLNTAGFFWLLTSVFAVVQQGMKTWLFRNLGRREDRGCLWDLLGEPAGKKKLLMCRRSAFFKTSQGLDLMSMVKPKMPWVWDTYGSRRG